MAFARVEVCIVLARLLQQFELKLLDKKIKPHMGATLEPRPGVFMQVRRKH
jgi:cytochrome P450